MLQSDTLEEVTQSLPNKRHNIFNTLVSFFSLHFLFPINLLLWEKKKKSFFFLPLSLRNHYTSRTIKPKTWESFLIVAFLCSSVYWQVWVILISRNTHFSLPPLPQSSNHRFSQGQLQWPLTQSPYFVFAYFAQSTLALFWILELVELVLASIPSPQLFSCLGMLFSLILTWLVLSCYSDLRLPPLQRVLPCPPSPK